MGRRALSVKLAFLLGCALPFAESHAQTEALAHPPEIVIWYRASHGCPSGADFVSSIQIEGRTTRLARVGDHVDYVITLESDGFASGGRLERQTEQGTIAISELHGAACSEVGEALALSLTLAVTPPSQPAPPTPPVPAEPADAAATAPVALASSPRRQPVTPADPIEERAEPRPPAAPPALPEVPRWWIGGGFTGALGVTPDPSFGANAFVGPDWDLVSHDRPASFRAGPAFSYSRTPVEGVGQVDQWVTTLAFEFCPLSVSAGALGFAPCAVAEGGLFVASTNRDSSLTSVNFWGGVGPALRGRAQLSSGLQLGLTAAVKAPFSRLELIAGEELLYRTPPVVFSLGADLSWAIP